MPIVRWPSSSPGRSRITSYNGLIWTVANATDPRADFDTQVRQSLAMLEAHLQEAGSSRRHLLSLQVLLARIEDRGAFDVQWREWIGSDARCWPQRSCIEVGLAPGLAVELVAVAAPADTESQRHDES